MKTHQNALSVFISYAHKDEAWLKELVKHLSLLQRRGLISTWYDRQIIPGTNWSGAIDERLEQASIILLLISPDFLVSDYCFNREMQRALERHEIGTARVIPIIMRPVDWEGAPFAHLQALPTSTKAVTTWSNQDEAFVDVISGIRRAIENLPWHSTSAPHAVLPTISNIPYPRNPFFTDRDDLLSSLHTQLQRGQATALFQPQAINGLGGIGKTQVALEYAYRYFQKYEAVFWTLADTRESLIAGYTTIADLLNLPEKDEEDQTRIVTVVFYWFKTHTKWLLVLDNADDLAMVRELLPPGTGHTLLTTRAQALGRLAYGLEVDTMDHKVGALLLLRRAGLLTPEATLETAMPADIAIAEEISTELGGLPLALDQAGAYLEETRCGLSAYQSLYRSRRAEMLKERGGLVDDHPEPVATTWSLSFQKVEQQNPAAAELLRLCSFLAPDAIPEEIIIKGAEHLGPVLSPVARDPLALNRALSALGAYSLIRRDASASVLSLHRLVQAVLKDAMPVGIVNQWIERAVLAVNAAFPEVEFSVWSRCEQCLPHAQICIAQFQEAHLTLPEAGALLHRMGRYLIERARYAEAEPLYQRALAIREEQLGPQHPDTANILHSLAYLYMNQGKYAEAESFYLRALEIRERQLGSQHPDTARTLINLGYLYERQGRYAQAEPLYLRTLAIREQQLGPQHPRTATTLNTLAGLYVNQGKYVEAEPLYLRALEIREQQLGPQYPDTSNSLNNLARLYEKQNKHVEAESLYLRALAIREQQLGPQHPSTAATLNNLASLYEKQNKHTEAESLYLRALAIREQQLGSQHPDTATSLNNLADLYRVQGKYAEAESLYLRALAIREQQLGPQHPDTANSLHWLAFITQQQQQYERAKPLYDRALAIYEHALGSNHPTTKALHHHYRSLLKAMGNNAEAQKKEEDA